MRHLTSVHQGEPVDQDMLNTLRALHRTKCTFATCDGFRRVGNPCNKCHKTTEPQPIQIGDLIPGPRMSDTADQRRLDAAAASQSQPTQEAASIDDIDLPNAFCDRVRVLPGGQSQIHIPLNLRDRQARIWAQTLEGLNEDLPGWTLLEEARTRLLLTTPPKGIHVQSELNERTTLWEASKFEELLSKIETQNLMVRSGKRKRRKGNEEQQKQNTSDVGSQSHRHPRYEKNRLLHPTVDATLIHRRHSACFDPLLERFPSRRRKIRRQLFQ